MIFNVIESCSCKHISTESNTDRNLKLKNACIIVTEICRQISVCICRTFILDKMNDFSYQQLAEDLISDEINLTRFIVMNCTVNKVQNLKCVNNYNVFCKYLSTEFIIELFTEKIAFVLCKRTVVKNHHTE